MAIFATETKLTFLDIDQVFGNVFELIETGESYIRKNIKWPVNFKSGSMERVEIPEIPLEAIREAIINSLYLLKDIEKWASGFRRITEACEKANVKVKFEIRKNGFMVIFYRKNDEELLDLTGENKNVQEKTYEKTYENIEEKIHRKKYIQDFLFDNF